MSNPKAFISNAFSSLLNDCTRASILRRGGLSYAKVLNQIRERRRIERNIRMGGSDFSIGGLSVQCLNPASFEILYDEIFLQQDYYFEACGDSPRIIDCGANIGLAILYFKLLYPKSSIVAFEPHPAAYEMARRNVKVNNLDGVELLQVAITNYNGSADLNFIEGEIMASTLTNRLDERGCQSVTTTVATARLRPWLEKHVDFLKLDIEGAEALVLADCRDLLQNVKNIFVEGHWTRGQTNNSAASIIGALENAGFNVLILSTESNRSNCFKPIRKAGPITSFTVYGTR